MLTERSLVRSRQSMCLSFALPLMWCAGFCPMPGLDLLAHEEHAHPHQQPAFKLSVVAAASALDTILPCRHFESSLPPLSVLPRFRRD
ncbi:hypothetical protein GGI35DRAFT_451667 [Trichoderma velutinum]